MKSTSHVWRIFMFLIAIGILGFFARWILRPASFGEIGHYRADSLVEMLNLELVHQGKEVCRECHDTIYEIHEKDIHFSVQCENCHGPGNIHVKYHQGELELISKNLATMPKEYTLEGCLFCHRELLARPRTYAQVNRTEHYEFLHVTDEETNCIACHNPHEPLFLLDEVSQARVHPIIYECDVCHDIQPTRDYKEVEDHPVIFVCGDCHPAVVKDFTDHEHSFMRCTACHLYHPENETSGRIFKISNRRFCLLCHEEKPFKHKEQLPQIVWPEHLVKMAPVMRRNPDDLEHDATACLNCHFDSIHDSKLIGKLQEQRE